MSPKRRISLPGGGGGSGLVEWGPDFGEGAGNDGTTLVVEAGLTLEPYGLIYEIPAEAGAGLSLLDLFGPSLDAEAALALSADLSYQALPAEAALDLDFMEMFGVLPAKASLAFELGYFPVATPGAEAGLALTRQELIDYNDWANAVVTNSPAFTNPNNAIDKDIATFAHIIATASGIGGTTSNTVNGTLIVSLPDFSAPFTDFTIDSVLWQHYYNTTQAGTPLTGAACNVSIDRSIDDGANWVNDVVVTAVNGGDQTRQVDLTAVLNTWTKINQFRTRWSGSVTSGTGLSASVAFRARASRLIIDAHKDF